MASPKFVSVMQPWVGVRMAQTLAPQGNLIIAANISSDDDDGHDDDDAG